MRRSYASENLYKRALDICIGEPFYNENYVCDATLFRSKPMLLICNGIIFNTRSIFSTKMLLLFSLTMGSIVFNWFAL